MRLAFRNSWALQKTVLVADEGSYLPNGKLLCLWKFKTIEIIGRFFKEGVFWGWAPACQNVS